MLSLKLGFKTKEDDRTYQSMYIKPSPSNF